jgi:mannose-6-phosphate isomerase-like protein (cupin superfamily)
MGPIRQAAAAAERREGAPVRKLLVLVTLVVVGALAAPAALATPASGLTVITERTPLGQFDYVVQFITIAPGGTTGWHTHPAGTLVSVMRGTGTLYQADCSFQSFGRFSRFFQHPTEVHTFRNEGTVPLEIIAIYPHLPAGAPIRIDQPAPAGCPVDRT